MGYAYNFTELLAVQGSLAFESGWSDIRGRNDGALLRKSTDIYLTAIAALRVSWFNRRYVRMYSSAGAGITYNSLSEKRGDGSSPYASRELKAAWQIAPFGVIFGKTLFGFAEIGIGTCYAGCSVGIGYRF